MTEGSANHHLHTPPKELFEICNEASWKPRRRFAGNVDKKIHIAFRRVIAPCYRAENTDIACAMMGSEAQDVIASFPNFRSDLH